MPKLILQFEDRILKEYEIGLSLTIGRLPDNTVVIDNPAVSGHHACIFRDDDHFVVEDLESTNGTYVNEKHVIRHTLQNGDAVLVGKHKLVFVQMGGGAAVVPEDTEPTLANLDDTMYLDTKKHRELLANLREARWAQTKDAAGAPPTPSLTATPAAPAKEGVLRVLAGRADRPEYNLEARTSLIGKADGALVRLQGWFEPNVAVAIARNGGGYVATPLGGKTLVNSQRLNERCDLKDGDVLQVGGLTLEFRLKR